MNHVRVEVSWCSCYTLYSLQGIKQEHQQSRVRISNLLLLFLVFLFPLFFCCVFFFFCCFTQSFACKKKLKSTYWFLYFLRAARYGGVAAGATTALRYRTSTSTTTTTMLTCVSCICVSQYLCFAVSSCSPLLRRISLWRYPQSGHICQLFHFDSKAKQLQKCQKHVLMSPAVPAVPGRQTTISLYAAVG